MNSSDIPIGVVPPPPGVTADFGHHAETNTTNLLCAAIIWPVLAIAIVCIRMFTASRITRRWHADDFLIIGALVCLPTVLRTRDGNRCLHACGLSLI